MSVVKPNKKECAICVNMIDPIKDLLECEECFRTVCKGCIDYENFPRSISRCCKECSSSPGENYKCTSCICTIHINGMIDCDECSKYACNDCFDYDKQICHNCIELKKEQKYESITSDDSGSLSSDGECTSCFKNNNTKGVFYCMECDEYACIDCFDYDKKICQNCIESQECESRTSDDSGYTTSSNDDDDDDSASISSECNDEDIYIQNEAIIGIKRKIIADQCEESPADKKRRLNQ
jgi:hypothetical protein